MLTQHTNRMPWNLDWNLLRTFMVIVETGGITSAANTLGLTQPTVSSALKRLEATLDYRLVDRHTRSFEPTPEGRLLFQECRKIFGVVSELPGIIDAGATEVSGQLVIAMTSHVVSRHLDDLIASYERSYPNVEWAIQVTESRDVVNNVRQGHASVGFCLLENDEARLRTSVLYRQRFRLYCGRNHALFGRAGVTLDELAGEHSISFQTDTQTGPLFSVHDLRQRARLNPQLKGVSANLPEVRRMIVAGLGVGALPVHIAERDVESGLLWPLPPDDDLPSVELHAIWNENRRLNRAEAHFLEALIQMLSEKSVEERSY